MATRGDRLTIRKTRDVARLADAPEVTVLTPPTEGPNAKAIWAPELHRIGDQWYIYYSAAASGSEGDARRGVRSEGHPSELKPLMCISFAFFCLTNKMHS